MAIVQKDLSAEFRSRELLSAMLVFSMLVILIFNFALELNIDVRRTVTAGVLWTTFAFAGTLGLNRSMAVEKDRGCMDGLLLAPVDRSAIFFGKAISNLAFMLIVEAIVIPLYALLYNETRIFPVGIHRRSAAWLHRLHRCRHTALRHVRADAHAGCPAANSALSCGDARFTGVRQSQRRHHRRLAASRTSSPRINLLIVYDIVFIAISFMVFDFVVEE
jgi:heme exporter protein B